MVTRSAEYSPALDGLRAVAALAVLLSHAEVPGFGGGARGVDVFFVLSGFLITRLLRDQWANGGVAVWCFWWNRGVRLVPALALLVLFFLVAPVTEYGSDRGWPALLAISYTTNFDLAAGGQGGPLEHTWSLAVEEHFYLLWPLLLPLIFAARRPAMLLFGAWLFLAATRAVLAHLMPWEAVYYPSYLHAGGLFLGAALAFERPGAWVGPYGAIAMVAVLTVLEPAHGSTKLMLAAPLTELATAAVIAGLMHPTRMTALFSFEPARRLGLISYGIYLWHWPIIFAIQEAPWWAKAPVTLGLSVVVAAASFYLVESPIRQRFRIFQAVPNRPAL